VLIGAVFLLSAATATAQATDSVAGAAFPYPIYAKRAKTYKAKPDLPLQGFDEDIAVQRCRVRCTRMSLSATSRQHRSLKLGASMPHWLHDARHPLF
jgi:hypothetical protein